MASLVHLPLKTLTLSGFFSPRCETLREFLQAHQPSLQTFHFLWATLEPEDQCTASRFLRHMIDILREKGEFLELTSFGVWEIGEPHEVEAAAYITKKTDQHPMDK